MDVTIRGVEFPVEISTRDFIGASGSTTCPDCELQMSWELMSDLLWHDVTHAGYTVERYGRSPSEYREREVVKHLEWHFDSGTHSIRVKRLTQLTFAF